MTEVLRVAPQVANALRDGVPVVALETSIVGQGLPAPHNLRAARGCEAAIKEEGAVPATVAVLGGQVCVGLDDQELEQVAAGSVKVSARDLGPAIAHGLTGATTVAATLRAASMARIVFMATGGIGGVHRGHPEDESADLDEIARHRVAVVCAGAKIILDLRLTLERLETLGVPVLGYGCDEFPAFYSRHSGCPVSARVDGEAGAADMLRMAWATGAQGVVLAVPPPRELEGADALAHQAASELTGVAGADVTPRLLARIAELSQGRSVDLNVELVINNARVAARVARTYYAGRER